MSEVSAGCKDPAPPKKAAASVCIRARCGYDAMQDFPRTLEGFEQLPVAR